LLAGFSLGEIALVLGGQTTAEAVPMNYLSLRDSVDAI